MTHGNTRCPIERFNEQHTPEPNCGCWLWTGCLEDGYARFNVNQQRISAHRFSYELHKGPIPDGLQIDHLCRVRSCVNPDHLEAVTCKENVLRGVGLSAQNARKTHCKRGHEFNEKNTYMHPNGSRQCRTCRRAARKGRLHDTK